MKKYFKPLWDVEYIFFEEAMCTSSTVDNPFSKVDDVRNYGDLF